MNDIAGFIVFLVGCSAISMIFCCLFNDKSKKTDEQKYQEMVKCENVFRKDFEGDFIE